MTTRPLAAGAMSAGDCDAHPAPLDRPPADYREQCLCDGRDRAGLGTKGPPGAARRGWQSRRPGGARTESRSLSAALDRPDRRHLDRRPLGYLRGSHLGGPTRAAARDLSLVYRAIRPCDQHGGCRDWHFVFLADPRRTPPKAHRTAPPPTDCPCALPLHARGFPGGITDRMVLERRD